MNKNYKKSFPRGKMIKTSDGFFFICLISKAGAEPAFFYMDYMGRRKVSDKELETGTLPTHKEWAMEVKRSFRKARYLSNSEAKIANELYERILRHPKFGFPNSYKSLSINQTAATASR